MTIRRTWQLTQTTYEILESGYKKYRKHASGYSPIGAIYELLNDGYFGALNEEVVVRKFGIVVTRQELLQMAKQQRTSDGAIKYKENGKVYVEVTI